MGTENNGEKKKDKNREKQNANLLTPDQLNARFTPEERRENASKAGKASAKKKRENRMMIDLARKMLEMPVGEAYKNQKAIMERFGVPENEQTYAAAILTTMMVKAFAGDANAAKYVRDSAGLDALTALREEQFEYEKENGKNINVNLEGELKTQSRVQIYLPERDDDPE